MAYLTYDQLLDAFLPVLRDRLLLTNVVTIDGRFADRAHVGKKVAITRPRRRTANRRTVGATTALTFATAEEDEVSITLTEDIYDGVPITDAQLTLDIRDFGVQVMNPLLTSVVDLVEGDLATLIEGATYPAASQIPFVSGGNPLAPILSGRRVLNDNEVPMENRILLVGADLEEELLADSNLLNIDKSGMPAVLREATLGRIYGFTVVSAGGKIDSTKSYAMHKTAFLAAMRAPVVPGGAVAGSRRIYEGIPLMMIRDYDHSTTQDRLSVRTFLGTTVNEDHVGTQSAVYNGVLQRAAEITWSAT